MSGWQRKHDAIAAAALVLFARDGYERTSVDAIAAEAGASKRRPASPKCDLAVDR